MLTHNFVSKTKYKFSMISNLKEMYELVAVQNKTNINSKLNRVFTLSQ